MRTADIEYSQTGHIAHARLNRPQGMNAITPEMDELLWKTWRSINDDPDVWCVILSAEGEAENRDHKLCPECLAAGISFETARY